MSFNFVMANDKTRTFTTAYKGLRLSSHCLSCHRLPLCCLPILILLQRLPVTTQTCLTQPCPGPLHLLAADQKCLCLDIHKTCFFTFLKCCPLWEAFCFHSFSKIATLALTQPLCLSLSLFHSTTSVSNILYFTYVPVCHLSPLPKIQVF